RRQPAKVHRRPRDHAAAEGDGAGSAHLGRGRRRHGAHPPAHSRPRGRRRGGAGRLRGPRRDPGALRPRRGDGRRTPVARARGRRDARGRDRRLDGGRLPAVIRLARRAAPSRLMLWGAPLVAVALTFVLGAALFAAMGQPPLSALHALFVSPLSDLNGVSELLLKASPLCLIALGLAVGFRSNIWNIGAEGQMYIGAVFATGLAIHFQARWGGWMLPAMILAGIAGGLAWAAIVAALRAHLHAS